MTGRATEVETAQLLVKEMGRDSLLAYFTKRLQVGKGLASRPLVLAALVQLAGHESKALLIPIINDHLESPPTRVAAAKALGQLAKHMTESDERSEVTRALMQLLK